MDGSFHASARACSAKMPFMLTFIGAVLGFGVAYVPDGWPSWRMVRRAILLRCIGVTLLSIPFLGIGLVHENLLERADAGIIVIFWILLAMPFGLVFTVMPFGDQCSPGSGSVSYTHLRAHETPEHLVCRLLLE